MYESGVRSGQLYGRGWDQVVLVDNTLAEVSTVLDMRLDKWEEGG